MRLGGVSVAPSFVAVLMLALLQVLGHPHLLDESVELDVSYGFCKAVCNHLVSRDVRKLGPL